MARNSEKQYGKLNRLVLQKERDEFAEKHPSRPRLANLSTVDEIKKWLPSIKRDIEYNLKQSEVTCYSDKKVAELHNEVERLEKEYKSFVHKIRRVDSTVTCTPWTSRPYERKNKLKLNSNIQDLHSEDESIPKKIATPILDDIHSAIKQVSSNVIWNCNERTVDAPLEFTGKQKCYPNLRKKRRLVERDELLTAHLCKASQHTTKLSKIFGIDHSETALPGKFVSKPTHFAVERISLKDNAESTGKSLLGLQYSSSEEEIY